MAKTSQNLVLRNGESGAETVSIRVQRSMVSMLWEKSMVGVRNECCVTASVVGRENGKDGAEGMLTRHGLVRREEIVCPELGNLPLTAIGKYITNHRLPLYYLLDLKRAVDAGHR